MAQINTRIILRNDSSFNWVLNEEVVLLKGEVGIEFLSDESCKVKIGDGVKPWKDLKYFGGEQLLGDDKSIVINDKVISLKGFEKAEVGAQPRKNAAGEIEWVVPSTKTVDELKDTVAGLQSDISSLQEIVNGTGENSVDAKIDSAINEFAAAISDDGTVNTLKELIDYVSEHGKEVTAIITKLETIEENAQVNVIEGLSIDGVAIELKDKVADIPVASLDKLGVVKSSTGANKVNIAKDGTMSVNKVDINSIVVPMDEEVVLNGGNAAGASLKAYATSIGNYGYSSVEDAIAHADNGDVITLQGDLNRGTSDINNIVIDAEDVTLNLNNNKIVASGSNGAVKVTGGKVTLDGAGEVKATLGSDNYSMAVWAENGKVVINDGIYTNATDDSIRGTDLIYASGTGLIEINGGVFEAAKPEWTLNVKDADYKAGTANIIVKGGSFKNFDPSNNRAEGPGTNFVALGYQSVKEGDYYVVKLL